MKPDFFISEVNSSIGFFGLLIEVTRKTTVPQKIDDFGANSQGQLDRP
jgi:hypothetical protein